MIDFLSTVAITLVWILINMAIIDANAVSVLMRAFAFSKLDELSS